MIISLNFRDKLEDDQEFAIVGDVSELQAKIEAEKEKEDGEVNTNAANGQASTSQIGKIFFTNSFIQSTHDC